MTIKTVLKYKGESKQPSEPHTITWLEYVTLKTECDNAASTRQTNSAMGIKLMQQAEKIRKLREAAQAVINRWDSQDWKDLEATGLHISHLCKALKKTETT